LRHDPNNIDARLMRAQIRIHLNDTTGARKDCLAIMPRVDVLIGSTCLLLARTPSVNAELISSEDLERDYRLITALLDKSALRSEHSWSVGVAADLAARLHKRDEANHWYELALRLDPNSHYARASYQEWRDEKRQ
jgi:hypothetical protein